MQFCNVGSACKTIDVVHTDIAIAINYLQLRASFAIPTFPAGQHMVVLSPERLAAKGGEILWNHNNYKAHDFQCKDNNSYIFFQYLLPYVLISYMEVEMLQYSITIAQLES